MNKNHKTVLVYSGGLDSTSLLSQLLSEGDEITLLNFNYGSKHNLVERESARKVAKHYGLDLKEVDMTFINEIFKSDLLQSGGEVPKAAYDDATQAQTVVPARNAIMGTIAAGFADSIDYDRIALGIHKGDKAVYFDCRKPFVEAFDKAVSLATGGKISVIAPFIDIDKGDIAKIGHDNNAPLHMTWTCYSPVKTKEGKVISCGVCGSDQERKFAFEKYNLIDEIEYENKRTFEDLSKNGI
jgi:7-cyano-7-deazaguanine synthase